ncbi:MAG: hypothetical protein WC119_07535 [Synergistaceae bacterium]
MGNKKQESENIVKVTSISNEVVLIERTTQMNVKLEDGRNLSVRLIEWKNRARWKYWVEGESEEWQNTCDDENLRKIINAIYEYMLEGGDCCENEEFIIDINTEIMEEA